MTINEDFAKPPLTLVKLHQKGIDCRALDHTTIRLFWNSTVIPVMGGGGGGGKTAK